MLEKKDNNKLNNALGFKNHLLVLAILVISVTFIYVFSNVALGDFLSAALISTFALLIYSYLDCRRRMWRHAILSHITVEQSKLRKMFWESTLSKLMHSLFSIFSAIILLVIINRLKFSEWILLYLSVFSFYVFFLYFENKLINEIVPKYRIFTSLSLACWLNLFFVIGVSAIYNLYFVEYIDTQSLTITDVASSAFIEGSKKSESELIGALIGIDRAWSEVSLHLMQLATSGIQTSPINKIIAWVVYFIYIGLQYVFLWLVLLGAFSVTVNLSQQGWAFFAEASLYKSAAYTLAGLFLIFLLSYQVGELQFFSKNKEVINPLISNGSLRPANVDYNESLSKPVCIPGNIKKELADLERLLLRKNITIRADLEEKVSLQIDSVKNEWQQAIEPGVEGFLDWNFSLLGQYQSYLHWLITVMPGDPIQNKNVQLMMSKLDINNEQIFDSLDELMQHKIQENVKLNPSEYIGKLEDNIDNLFREGFYDSNLLFENLLKDVALIDPGCLSFDLSSINLNSYFNSSYAGYGAGSTATTLLVSRSYKNKSLKNSLKINTKNQSKQLAKKSGKKIATKVASGIATKIAASGTAGAVGGFCGPAAVVCGPLFALTAIVGSEIVINTVDEALNREETKNEIMNDLDELIVQQLNEMQKNILLDLDEALSIQEKYQVLMFNAFKASLEKYN